MTITEISPSIPVKPELSQCNVTVSSPAEFPGYREQRHKKMRPSWDYTKCQRHATIDFNGRKICRVHAGQEALKLLIKEPCATELLLDVLTLLRSLYGPHVQYKFDLWDVDNKGIAIDRAIKDIEELIDG